MVDEPYNAGERRHVKGKAREAQLDSRDLRDFIVAAMQQRQGRKWFLNLLESCHIFRTSFASNALTMAFSEGERNIGIQVIVAIQEHCPDLYVLMMREKNERSIAESSTRPAASDTYTGAGPDSDSRASGDDAPEPSPSSDGGWNFPAPGEISPQPRGTNGADGST